MLFKWWHLWNLPIVSIDGADLGDYEIHFSVRDRHGEIVGEVMATIPPGDSRIFVRGIKITKPFRRRGLGTSTVRALAEETGRAVSPVRERGDGKKFWPKMRTLSGRFFMVTEAVDPDELRTIVAKARASDAAI